MKQAKEKAPQAAATAQSAKGINEYRKQYQDTGECLESQALKQIISYFYQLNARGIQVVVDFMETVTFNQKYQKGVIPFPERRGTP